MANPKSLSKRTTLRLNHRAIVTGLIILVYVVACCCPALRFDKYYPGDNAPQLSELGSAGLLCCLAGSAFW